MQTIHRTRFFIRTSCSGKIKTVTLPIYNDAGNLRNVATKKENGDPFSPSLVPPAGDRLLGEGAVSRKAD
jgi:hypothetical protein